MQCTDSRYQKVQQSTSKKKLKREVSGNHLPIDANDLACLKCDKVFSDKRGYDLHIKSHLGKYKFWCDECKVGYQNKSNYNKHMTKHTGQYLYTCMMCQKGFNERSHLLEHENQHAGVKFSCRNCGKDFFLEKKRDGHEKSCSSL